MTRRRAVGDVSRYLAAGVGGQVLVALGLLIPVALSPTPALIELVWVATLSTATMSAAILALPMLYPSIPDEQAASAALKAAVALLVAVSGAFVAAGIVVAFFEMQPWTLVGLGLLLLTQGADTVLGAWLVRRQDVAAIGRKRLRYGLASFVLNSAAAILSSSRWSLVVAAVGAYAGSTLWMGWSMRSGLRLELARCRRAPWASSLRYAVNSVLAVLSTLTSGISFLLAGLMLAAIGSLAAPWAVASRVAGGFFTVGNQIAAPLFDARLGQAIREGDPPRATRAMVQALLASAAIAIGGVGAAILACALTHRFEGLAGADVTAVVLSTILFWGTALLTATTMNALGLAGAVRHRFVIEALRCAVIALVVVLADGQTLLIAVSLATMVFNLAVIAALLATARSLRRAGP